MKNSALYDITVTKQTDVTFQLSSTPALMF